MDTWNLPPPKGSLPCLLCKCVISFANKDKTRYFRHLALDHGAVFNKNLVLIINLLEKSQLLKLISRVKGEEEEEDRRRRSRRDADTQTDPPRTQKSVDDLMILKQLSGSEEDPLLEDSGDFSILDVTKDDLLLAPGDDLQDYSGCSAGARRPQADTVEASGDTLEASNDLVENSRNSLEGALEGPEESLEEDLDTLEISAIGVDTLNISTIEDPGTEPTKYDEKQNKSMEMVDVQRLIEKKPNQDMVSVYLQSCSEYFKKFPHQLKSCSREQVENFIIITIILIITIINIIITMIITIIIIIRWRSSSS